MSGGDDGDCCLELYDRAKGECFGLAQSCLGGSKEFKTGLRGPNCNVRVGQ